MRRKVNESIANRNAKASAIGATRPEAVTRRGPNALPLLMPLHPGGVIRAQDNSRDLLADKVGYELLLAFIAVKVNFRIHGRIVIQDFRCHLGLCSTAHDNFIYPHARIIIMMKTDVQMRLSGC